MGKTTTREKTSTPASKPEEDYDVGIREQLEPYGLELSDIIAVLEEDPSMLQYVKQGQKGESIHAKAKKRPTRKPDGRCARGVKDTINGSSATSIENGNGNDIQLHAQATGDYFSITYHTAETPDSLSYVQNGTILSWDNQDDPRNRRNPNNPENPGGFRYGHVTVKIDDDNCYSDGNETIDGLIRHGVGKQPRYGSLSYVTFPKDVTFDPNLINLAMMRKRERETDREIPVTEMPQQPDKKKMDDFLEQNPRLGYLMLKQINPDVTFDLTADRGKLLKQYYDNLPQNSPERAALDLLVSKDIKNVMDYAAVNQAIEDVSNEVLRLRNPEAYARRKCAKEGQITFLCQVTPTYIYQLQQSLTGEAKRMSSQEYMDYIKTLDKNSTEYMAISQLARRSFDAIVDPVEVKLAIANIVKDHREVKPEEINSLFENTPALVYHVQKEFGTQKAGGIRTTSELHEYYNNLPKGSPERRAIEELAMAHIEISETNVASLDKAIESMAHHYKKDRELEPRPAVHIMDLRIQVSPDSVLGRRAPKKVELSEDRASVRAGFEKMDSQKWAQMVDDYLKSTQVDEKGETKDEMKQQREEANQRFEVTLQSLFADNGNSDCKEVMKRSKELLGEYMQLNNDEVKSLEGFIKFVETAPKEDNQTSKTAEGENLSLNILQLPLRGQGR